MPLWMETQTCVNIRNELWSWCYNWNRNRNLAFFAHSKPRTRHFVFCDDDHLVKKIIYESHDLIKGTTCSSFYIESAKISDMWKRENRLFGAMGDCLILDRKVACSISVEVKRKLLFDYSDANNIESAENTSSSSL